MADELKKEHCCSKCKYCDRRDYVKDEGFWGYCVEDGDQVGLTEERFYCWSWKDPNDKTPDIDWP